MTDDARHITIFSGSFGGGSAAAARAMEAYFAERHARSIDVTVVDFLEEFLPPLGVLAKFAYQQPEEFFPSFVGRYEELLASDVENPVVAELRRTGLGAVEEYFDTHAPDAVVSTFPLAGGAVAEVAQGSGLHCATTVLDYDPRRGWFDPVGGTYFVAGREARERLAVRGLPWEQTIESGIPIDPSFGERIEPAGARRELGLVDRFTVLLMANAGSPGDVADVASRLASAGVQVAAVTGHNERMRERLEKEATQSPLLRVFGFVKGMHTMMAASDIAVCRVGGLVIAEAVASGLPVVVYGSVPGQKVDDADFLVAYGVVLPTRDNGDVVEKVKFLSTHDARLAQMSESARRLGKPDAVQTVCERVLAALR